MVIKLSIIIPYYDTFEYTYTLLKELEKQVTDEVEVILIDDGCNETKLDEFGFVKITHLDKNYGASHAWNVGLDQALGNFIGFIDSDDMIEENYISTLIKAIDDDHADEIIFDFIDINKNFIYKRPRCRAIWKAIYRKNIVPRFDETRLYNTDVPFKQHLLKTEHSTYYLDVVLYQYRSVREGSITWKKLRGMFQKEEVNNGKKI